MFFSEPRNFGSLTNKEISINGAKIDNSQATIGLSQFIIRYDISKLPKDQDVLSIILKDTTTNTYSNELIIHIGTYSASKIQSIDIGKGTSSNFTFDIRGNTMTFFGDMYKLKVNINGKDYTRDGTKEPIKDGSGVIQKDSSGADRYEIKNKIEMKRTGEGLEFDFFYSLLNDGENILSVKNENTGRESNRVSFTKKGQTPIQYNYLTGAELTESGKKEGMVFEIGKDLERKVNPTTLAVTDRNISLGRLQLSNMRNNDYYSLDFTLETDLAINPFSQLTLDTASLETMKNREKFSFRFKKQGYGKDFKADTELLSTINELYNTSDAPFL